jgi:N-methylhydantoinase B/oxoprolinase/acetone carboxylase alpha subunit
LTLTAPGQEIVMRIPGGAGYGSPAERDSAAIEADRLAGLRVADDDESSHS